MLNVEETIDLLFSYITQRDIVLRILMLSVGSFLTLNLVRGQVAEINLLQLIPGVYFGILLATYLLLLIFSEILVRFPFESDNRKASGTKTSFRFESKMQAKISFFLYTFGLFVIPGIILPISLECFTNSTEKTLENLWSFEDLNTLESNLFYTLTWIFQMPLIFTAPTYSEQTVRIFNLSFKDYIFVISIVAGIITPTVDVITQLAFIIVGIVFYFFARIFFSKQILFQIQDSFLTSFFGFLFFEKLEKIS